MSAPNDVIVGVDGTQPPTLAQLEYVLTGYRPGGTVTVDILRSGKPMRVKITLGSLTS